MTEAPEKHTHFKALLDWIREVTPIVDPAEVAAFATATTLPDSSLPLSPLTLARNLYVIRFGRVFRAALPGYPYEGRLIVIDGLPVNMPVYGPNSKIDEALTHGLAYLNLRVTGVRIDDTDVDAAVNGFSAVQSLWLAHGYFQNDPARGRIQNPLAGFVAAYLADGAINTLKELVKQEEVRIP